MGKYANANWTGIRAEEVKVGMIVWRKRLDSFGQSIMGRVESIMPSAMGRNIVATFSDIEYTHVGDKSGSIGGTSFYLTDDSSGCRPIYLYYDKPIEKKTIKSTVESTIMKVSKFIQRLGLSSDDKLLIDTGLEDPTGVPTDEGKEALNELLWREFRPKLVEAARQMKEEEKKAKKEDKE